MLEKKGADSVLLIQIISLLNERKEKKTNKQINKKKSVRFGYKKHFHKFLTRQV